MKRLIFCALIAGFALPCLAWSKDGRKVNAPSWVNKPPRADDGLYGVGAAQGEDVEAVTSRADSLACQEIGGFAGTRVAAWAAKAKEVGESEELFKGVDESVASLQLGHVRCQIQKREQRKDPDGTYRAYALGYLSRLETVAAVKTAQANQFHEGTKETQSELDQAIQNNPAPQE